MVLVLRSHVQHAVILVFRFLFCTIPVHPSTLRSVTIVLMKLVEVAHKDCCWSAPHAATMVIQTGVHPLKSMASGHLKIKKGLVLFCYWPFGLTLLRVYLNHANILQSVKFKDMSPDCIFLQKSKLLMKYLTNAHKKLSTLLLWDMLLSEVFPGNSRAYCLKC